MDTSSPLHQLFSTQKDFLQHCATNAIVRGRFAPSPSGPLHFGSLFAALGSYLHAKSNQGKWFVRIEDIDATRVVDQAFEQILTGLQAFGMQWDCDELTANELQPEHQHCLHQTARLARYEQVLHALAEADLVYGCDCTRKQIKQMPDGYNRHCRERNLPLEGNAVRLKNSHHKLSDEDYIIKRRDGLFSYQLVVVVDDIDQGITHVVRGADIMPLTTRQCSLYQLFGVTPPTYLHLPLAVSEPGKKLSKQNHAPAINCEKPLPELLQALTYLGLPVQNMPGLNTASPRKIVDWAVGHCDISDKNGLLMQQSEIIL